MEEGGLAGAGRADQGDGFAREGDERDVRDGGRPGVVGKADVLEADLAAESVRPRTFGEVFLCRTVEDFADALHRGTAAVEGLAEGVDLRNRLEEEAPGEEEVEQDAGVHAGLQDPPRAIGDHGDDARLGEDGDAWPDERLAAHHAHVFRAGGAGGFREAAETLRLAGVGLDLSDAGKRVVEQGVKFGGGLAGLAPLGLGDL